MLLFGGNRKEDKYRNDGNRCKYECLQMVSALWLLLLPIGASIALVSVCRTIVFLFHYPRGTVLDCTVLN